MADNAPVKLGGSEGRSARENGSRNAAIFLLSIGEEKAAAILAALDDFEIRDISREMSSLGKTSSTEVERVLNDFINNVGTKGGAVVGSWNATERFLMSFMGEDRTKELMEEMRGPAGRTMWEKLTNVSEDVLANYLKNEYPQTVAVILSRIRPSHAAKVLIALPEYLSVEVMERILLMDNVSREIIESVEDSLRNEFMRNLAARNKRDSHELMADIFNNLDRSNEQKFMELLETRSPEDAEKIRALMFTFDDLMKTDDRGIQAVLREVDKNRLAVALKGANPELRDRFFKNMSERAAKIMKEDMDAMGPVRIKDVDEAQMDVVVVAKKLADSGEIVILDEDSGDEFIS